MNNNGGLLGASSVILAAPVLAYGFGYAFYRGYFGLFGVDVLGLPIPIEHYFAQGVLSFFIALVASADTGLLRWIPLLSSAILVAALVFPQFARIRTIVAWLAIVPMLASGVTSAFQQGRDEAETLRDGPPAFVDLGGLAGAEVQNSRACSEQLAAPAVWSARRAELVDANECGGLRSLWQDAESTIVATWVCSSGSQESCRWRVFRLSTEHFGLAATENLNGLIETSGEGQ